MWTEGSTKGALFHNLLAPPVCCEGAAIMPYYAAP